MSINKKTRQVGERPDGSNKKQKIQPCERKEYQMRNNIIKVTFPSQVVFYMELDFLLKQDLFSYPWFFCRYGE